MAESTIEEQLDKYLADAYSIEEQALVQMRRAPDLAGDPRIAEAFREHCKETARHERLVRERIEARGGSTPRFRKAVMQVGGLGFVLFAKSQPDTTGKLVAHAYSYEGLEEASYELLGCVAMRAGDDATVEMADDILRDEVEMAERLAGLFGAAVDASLRERDPDDIRGQLVTYLADAHAIAQQGIQLFERGRKIVDDPELARIFEEHLAETREHSALWEARLDALGGNTSVLKDAAMRLGGLNWAAFFQAHPDTPGKLMAFAYAFERLEIGGFEQLRRVAERIGDADTAATAERILAQDCQAARDLKSAFGRAVAASLEEVGAAG